MTTMRTLVIGRASRGTLRRLISECRAEAAYLRRRGECFAYIVRLEEVIQAMEDELGEQQDSDHPHRRHTLTLHHTRPVCIQQIWASFTIKNLLCHIISTMCQILNISHSVSRKRLTIVLTRAK
ncbi:MAG: hypothetical protein UX68_C0022G0013 [Parcubacteria group bacterium GW2011_GWA2_46_9]|nr:MAG: hypothetical protein UX68_C0022G0013 [Parcubacteria group bacterium GW2011_GWA2_46_9]OGL84165.1 MAG: hypothetical protein A3I37_03285 [Candidatus Uhrbacteria bacterium RIFCSPLOWO2_02_FULL_46_19]